MNPSLPSWAYVGFSPGYNPVIHVFGGCREGHMTWKLISKLVLPESLLLIIGVAIVKVLQICSRLLLDNQSL